MCKKYAFKGDPNSNYNVHVGYCAVKGAPNSNCNVQVSSFQSDLTTISNEKIKKSFKPTSIPKKL